MLKYNVHFSWHTLNLRGKILTFPFFSTNTLIQTQPEGKKVSVTMLKPACSNVRCASSILVCLMDCLGLSTTKCFSLQVSPATTKFTEDFDFEAMNEKFNKAKIWGHLGKTNKSRLQDKKGYEKANDVEEDDVDEDRLPKFDAKVRLLANDANDVEKDDVDEDGLPKFDLKVIVTYFSPFFYLKIHFPEFACFCRLFMLRMTSLIRFLAIHSIVGWGEEGPSYPNKGK